MSSISRRDDDEDDDDYEDNDYDDDDTAGQFSFQSFKQTGGPGIPSMIGSSNMMLSSRYLEKTGPQSIMKKLKSSPSGGEYDVVPTMVETDQLILVCDANLDWFSKGGFYYAENSFYNPAVAPKYAITVSPSIYSKIWDEVDLSNNVPCGMYFCCQGGDGAHTGEAHKDFVDIELAWLLMGLVFVGMTWISICYDEP